VEPRKEEQQLMNHPTSEHTRYNYYPLTYDLLRQIILF